MNDAYDVVVAGSGGAGDVFLAEDEGGGVFSGTCRTRRNMCPARDSPSIADP